MNRTDRLLAVAQREFDTVVRARTALLLGAGYATVLFGLVATAGTGGYLPLLLDLLTPAEVLVPLLAFAFGYRAVLSDADSGELETIRTYPVSALTYVGGVFLGRLAGFVPIVVIPMLLAALAVVLGGPAEITVVAAHGTVDTPALYLRFVGLTAGFAVVSLAVAVAVSAVARSARQALALAVVVFVAFVVGFDATIVAALSGGLVDTDSLSTVAALGPNSAYRSLVYALAVGETYARSAPLAAPTPGAFSLLLWLGGSIAVAIRAVWSD